MKQESLDIVSKAIIEVLSELNIDSVDKVELMTNLYLLLSTKEKYKRSIEVLQKDHVSRKYK